MAELDKLKSRMESMQEKIQRTDQIQAQVNDLFKSDLLVMNDAGGVGVNPKLLSSEYQQWHEQNQPAVIDSKQNISQEDGPGAEEKAKADAYVREQLETQERTERQLEAQQ